MSLLTPAATENGYRDAVMLRELFVQERVVGIEHVKHRAVALEEVAKEADRLLIHRATQAGEGREIPFALLAQFLEFVDVQPGAGKLGREPAHARVAKHAASLRGERVGFVERAARREGAQFGIGGGGP